MQGYLSKVRLDNLFVLIQLANQNKHNIMSILLQLGDWIK